MFSLREYHGIGDSFSVVLNPPASQAGDWQIEKFTTLDGLHSIAGEWRALESRTCDPLTYFQGYDWCVKWCEQFADRTQRKNSHISGIAVFAVRKKGQLEAVFPFAIYRKWNLVNVARVIGAPFCEYANLLLQRSQFSDDDLKALWRAITSRMDADVIALDDFPRSSPFSTMIGSARTIPSAAQYSSLIELSEFSGWEDYQSSWCKSARRNRKKRFNKLANAGALEFKVIDGASGEFCALFDKAQALKVAWLREAALNDSKLSCKRFRNFVCSLSGSATQQDGCVAAALYLDKKPIAIEIGFCRNGHYYSYLGAFDPDYSNLSPGKALICEVLKWAFENGISSYDLLGNPTQYKQDWSNRTIDLASYRVGLNLLGAFYCLGTEARLRMVLKNLQEQLPAGLRRFLVRPVAQPAQGAPNA